MNVTWETGNGWMVGRIVGEFDLGGETFYRVQCAFGEVRALRNEELIAVL